MIASSRVFSSLLCLNLRRDVCVRLINTRKPLTPYEIMHITTSQIEVIETTLRGLSCVAETFNRHLHACFKPRLLYGVKRGTEIAPSAGHETVTGRNTEITAVDQIHLATPRASLMTSLLEHNFVLIG